MVVIGVVAGNLGAAGCGDEAHAVLPAEQLDVALRQRIIALGLTGENGLVMAVKAAQCGAGG